MLVHQRVSWPEFNPDFLWQVACSTCLLQQQQPPPPQQPQQPQPQPQPQQQQQQQQKPRCRRAAILQLKASCSIKRRPQIQQGSWRFRAKIAQPRLRPRQRKAIKIEGTYLVPMQLHWTKLIFITNYLSYPS